jgi:hypothetical protein
MTDSNIASTVALARSSTTFYQMETTEKNLVPVFAAFSNVVAAVAPSQVGTGSASAGSPGDTIPVPPGDSASLPVPSDASRVYTWVVCT